jgi:hypothetical protein
MATQFTVNQLRAIAYDAMGRGSETGQYAAFRLTLAGSVSNGLAYPLQNSGYTVGFFQWDFGSKGLQSAKDLVNAYNQWANQTNQISDVTSTANLIIQHGSGLTGQPYFPDTETGKQINEFLSTDAGKTFVMQLQERQYLGSLAPVMQQVTTSAAFANMSDDDARTTLAIFAKIKNQSGSVSQKLTGLLANANTTLDNIIDKISEVYGTNGNVIDGVNHTIDGAALYNRLQNSNSAIGQLWRGQQDIDPTLTQNFSGNASAQFFDACFRNPAAASSLLDKAEAGKGALIPLAAQAPGETRFAGITTDGNLFVLDQHMVGQRQINGQWFPTINGDENGIGVLIRPKLNPNGTVNLKKWVIALADGTELVIAEGDAPSMNLAK